MLPSSFYEATITLIPKILQKKKRRRTLNPVSLMKIDVKILNKMLANRIQKHIKKRMHPRW